MANKRILCVDDDADLRHIVREALQHEGYEVTEAQNGEEAIDRLGSTVYDLVLLDVVMPGPSGMDVLRFLSSKGNKTPIAMITGKAGFTLATESYMLGAVEYITKPFSTDFLIDAVKRLTKKG
ncbi:MAG TPA: response regulator [Bacteroidota bacterium]|nr:response regulator [Bacteroidota bacterium]